MVERRNTTLVSLPKDFHAKLQKYLKSGFVVKRGNAYALSPGGMFVSNYILSDILEFEDLGAYMGNF